MQNLLSMLVLSMQFKESTLLRILGIKDQKSSKDLLYFMDAEEYEKEYQSTSISNNVTEEVNFGNQSEQTSTLSQLIDTKDPNVRVEPFTSDLSLRTDGDIPYFPTVDGFTPDYVQIVSVKNTDPVSLDTFQIILEAVTIKLQYGMGIKQIESILFLIAFLRFVILCFNYNLKTSFLISAIGIFSCYLWYRHFLVIGLSYRQILYRIPYTFKFMSDLYDLEEYSKTYVFNFSSLYSIMWESLTSASTDSANHLYIDPISKIFSIMPKPVTKVTDYIYYTVYRDLGPQFIKYGKMFYRESISLATYMFCVRLNKKRCPYHIRWHWTCLIVLNVIEFAYVPLVYRLASWFSSLEFAYAASYSQELRMFTDIELQIQYLMMQTIVYTFVFAHLGFIVYAMLQAIFGQYFYIPFLTENTELHIGKREKTTYSGGNTPWDERDNSVWNIIIPGYAWYKRKMKKKKFRKRIQKIIKRFKQFFF